jgi:DNA-binding MarR family transcriptional regulator
MSESNTHLIQNLIPVLEDFVNRIGTEYPQKKVLDQLIPDSELKNIEVGITECRVIDCIEKNNPINAMKISSKMNITKSGISKIMSKLKKKELVNARYIEGNHKEVYYTLTAKGRRVYLLHDEIYNRMREKYVSMLRTYSNEELICISKFIHDALETL